MMPKQSPLHDLLEAAGAKFDGDNIHAMPSSFSSTPEHNDQLLNGSVLFDLSLRTKIEVAGKEALMFLHNLCTNEIKKLPENAGCEAFFTTNKAKVIAYGYISHSVRDNNDVLLFDTVAGLNETVFQHFDRHWISEDIEITDRTDELGMLHVCGATAPATLTEVLGQEVPQLNELHHTNITVPIGEVMVRRHDYLGFLGFDLIASVEATRELWQKLLTTKAEPAGSEVWETLRVEVGQPVFGKDLDENRMAAEVGRIEQAISYNKGCYLGQETIVMARDRGHVNRTLMGLILSESGMTRSGDKVFLGDKEVGVVTSAIDSQRFQRNLALAYLTRGNQDPGTELEVETANGRATATVYQLPFPKP
ncbi:MAG: aminomethyltransferase family protein [Gemmataceae bacterium]